MFYPKPAKTAREQIVLLKSRGMSFIDETAAENFLQNVSYYHLGFYWHDLRETNPQDPNDNERLETFKPDTRFEDIVERRYFDIRLQIILSSALKLLETSLKTKWVYHFSHKYGPLFYSNINIYENREYKGKTARDIINTAKNKFQDSTESFIQNYRKKHPRQQPEAWIIAEILSFGDLLYFISFLRQKDKQDFAHLYARNAHCDFLKQSEFIGILNQLRVIRNICAHNYWLWNRTFYNFPPIPKLSPVLKNTINHNAPQKLYNSLCFINYLLKTIEKNSDWQEHIKELMKNFPHYAPVMGFPPDWQNMPLWR